MDGAGAAPFSSLPPRWQLLAKRVVLGIVALDAVHGAFYVYRLWQERLLEWQDETRYAFGTAFARRLQWCACSQAPDVGACHVAV